MDQYFCTNSSWKEKKSRCWTSASILIPSGGSPVDSKELSNVKAQTMHVEVVGLQNKMFTAKEQWVEEYNNNNNNNDGVPLVTIDLLFKEFLAAF